MRHRRSFAGTGEEYALKGLREARAAFADVGRRAASVTSANAKDACPMIAVRFAFAAHKLDAACNVYRRESSAKGAAKFDKACAAAKRRQDRALAAAREACAVRMMYR